MKPKSTVNVLNNILVASQGQKSGGECLRWFKDRRQHEICNSTSAVTCKIKATQSVIIPRQNMNRDNIIQDV